MLYLGKAGGRHFVIHDLYAYFVRDSLRLLPVPINQVAVTDLSLLRSDGRTLLESIYRAKDFARGVDDYKKRSNGA